MNEAQAQHLDALREKARKTQRPTINQGAYAVACVNGEWKISNGRAWWDSPEVIEEIHEYADGTASVHHYVRGVGLFRGAEISAAGLIICNPEELTKVFNVCETILFEHGKRDDHGRVRRTVFPSEG